VVEQRDQQENLSIIMCGVERMEGVLIIAANSKALPRMDMSISGALRTQFMMVIVSGVQFSSWSELWSIILKLKSDQVSFPFWSWQMWRRQYREKITAPFNHQNSFSFFR